MKTKVWFVLSHLRAGGAERVFWILAQYFNKQKFDVSLVLLDSSTPFFPTNLEQVNIIQLDTVRASKSFFKLVKLIWMAKPDAVFTTGSHLNTLMSVVRIFAPIPTLVGREVNIPDLMADINGGKDKFWDRFVTATYRNVDIGVCQSMEIRRSLSERYRIPMKKLKIIPNPIIETTITNQNFLLNKKRLLAVGRLASEKGFERLLDIISLLPQDYCLDIAGEGPELQKLMQRVKMLGIEGRVKFLGLVKNVQELMANHGLLVITSFTEGFPNVVLEALSVGLPVVSFNVSGISSLLVNNFNGFIVEQNDLQRFAETVKQACNKSWESIAIKQDVYGKFGVHKIVKMYESLLISQNGVFSRPSIARVWQD